MVQVVAALIWDKNKFMICQRPATKARALLWEFVGGKVEPGETKEQALIRECREELAITVAPQDIFMEVDHVYPDITIHLTLFNASIVEGEPQMLEHNDIKWITTEEIEQYEFCPADTVILEKLKKVKMYHKLVRDKIPEIIEASGKTCTCEVLNDEAYLQMLDAKLNEELDEYQADKSIEEMADLLEVMRAVVTARGWTWQQLEQTRAAKAAKRGGFEKKLLLEFVVETEDKASKSKVLCTRISNKQDVIFAQLKKSAIEDYFWIQDNVRNCDVSENAEFQRHFGFFYQMRFVSQAFRKAYFCVFEKAKYTTMSFEAIAGALYPVDGKHQFSFISKMMHTLDTQKPIYDSLVDATVGLHRKASAPMEERLVSDASIINQLSALYREMTAYEEMQPILNRFEIEFPGKKLSDVKKIDFLLWALGAVDRKEKAGA